MRVQLTVPWTDANDVDHRAGAKLNVSRDTGRALIKEGRAAALGEGHDEFPPPPPKAGKGSGEDAWRAYAAEPAIAAHLDQADVLLEPGATRADVIAALERAGLPTDQPADTDDPGQQSSGDSN